MVVCFGLIGIWFIFFGRLLFFRVSGGLFFVWRDRYVRVLFGMFVWYLWIFRFLMFFVEGWGSKEIEFLFYIFWVILG